MITKIGVNYTKEDKKDHIGISAIIYNKDKTSILMQDHVKYSFWTIPVGKALDNQSAVDALKME